MVKIAVDAMGGDHAPLELVKGAVMATELLPEAEIVLVGDPAKIKDLLSKHKTCDRISIEPSEDVIGMEESPVSAVREKKKASVNVALQLGKDKKVDAVVSAGNTGALMAAALFKLGRIPGIERPAIATIFPAMNGRVLLLDMGANVDNKPKHLQQFGEMGSVYAEHLMRVKDPKIGLLNIGEETEKGNELTRAAWKLLKKAPINFIGNVESKEVLSGKVDVVVCDGFVGNLVLKLTESTVSFIMTLMKDEVSKSFNAKIGALLMLPAMKKLKKKLSYDEYGGAQLLGLNGVCVKAHGRSKFRAIMNAIRVADESVKENLVDCIKKVETK